MAHRFYHIDLKRDDFACDEDYLLERVKRGMAAGYTFKQCHSHWPLNFAMALGLSPQEFETAIHSSSAEGQKRKREDEERETETEESEEEEEEDEELEETQTQTSS